MKGQQQLLDQQYSANSYKYCTSNEKNHDRPCCFGRLNARFLAVEISLATEARYLLLLGQTLPWRLWDETEWEEWPDGEKQAQENEVLPASLPAKTLLSTALPVNSAVLCSHEEVNLQPLCAEDDHKPQAPQAGRVAFESEMLKER